MSEENKKSDEISFIALAVVLLVNLIIYKLDESAGSLVFIFFGFWCLIALLYKIAKIFFPKF